MDYQIKLASFAEIQLMLSWAATEGWNPGLNDANVFQLIDLQGFFIGYLGEEPISCISVVKYTANFGFLGLYIVKQNYRGKGFGYQIWQHAMNYAGQSNVGLDGVTAQQANYQKSGFKFAHKNMRYLLSSHSFKNNSNKNVIRASSIPFSQLASYEKTCFPCARNAFLAAWLLMKNATALVYYDKEVRGFGVIRECQQGYKIGPLFADNSEIANILLQSLCNSTPKKVADIYLDVTELNPEANHLVQVLEMVPVFETARMYTQQAPVLTFNKIFAMTTLEVG